MGSRGSSSGAKRKREAQKQRVNVSAVQGRVSDSMIKSIQDAVVDTMELFGQDPLMLIKAYSGSGDFYARTSLGFNDRYIELNLKWYGDEDKYDSQYKYDLSTGFHPQGTTYHDSVAHETGHVLEAIISKRMYDRMTAQGYVDFDTKMKYLYQGRGGVELVSEAIKNIKKTEHGKGKKVKELQYGISIYAADSKHETFAEAVADYRANRGKANPLSLEIVRLIKEELKK